MNYLDNLAEYIRSECGGGPIALYRIYAVLARAKAPNVTNEDVHDAWVGLVSERPALPPVHWSVL